MLLKLFLRRSVVVLISEPVYVEISSMCFPHYAEGICYLPRFHREGYAPLGLHFGLLYVNPSHASCKIVVGLAAPKINSLLEVIWKKMKC